MTVHGHFRGGLCIALLLGSGSAAAADESVLVKLTPAQRTNAQIELMTLDPAQAPAASGLTVTGRVEPASGGRTVLAAPAAGRIVDVTAFPGDHVRRDAVLLTLGGPDIAALQRGLREARANATVSAQRLARDRALLQAGVIAASRLEQSEAAYAAAAAQLRQASSALPGHATGSRDGEFQLRAPREGVHSGPRLAIGERVDAGDTLAVIGAAARLRVALAASPDVARTVRAGDRATIRSRGCEASAVVESVGVGVEPNQTVPLNARVMGESTCLLSGETVTASIAPRNAAQGAWPLPPRAFVRRGAETFIFVDRAAGFEPLQVDAAAAKSGFARAARLREGDRIAITGSALLKGAWIGIAEDE